ncbi:hypothetical protein F4806DRAFT_455402 [Annulohypoxylon nitens]|nr:hypothetical protein F4806DRAFT_455402 [Annulohypoxylon nitens]
MSAGTGQYITHENHNAEIGVDAFVIFLAVLSVALRFYTRIFTRAGLKADDWLILSALITALLTAALLLWANAIVPEGSGNIDAYYGSTLPNVILREEITFVALVLYFILSGASKLGILFMYYRIFAPSQRFRYAIFISSGLVIAWWLGFTVTLFANCSYAIRGWVNNVALQFCGNLNVLWMISGACEVSLDTLTLSLPVMMVVRLRLSLGQKLTVSAIFLLGGIVIITGIIRVVLGYAPGSLWPSGFNSETWTLVHSAMSLVCASLPIFKPLVRRISKSPFTLKISSILALTRRWKRLQPSDDRVIFGQDGHNSSGKVQVNEQMGISPLVTIGGTPMHGSCFYQQRLAYSGNITSSTIQVGLILGADEDEHEPEVFQQTPDVDIQHI